METFDSVEAAEEERNVKESGPDRIDDAFQPPAARSFDRPGVNAGFERKSLTHGITHGICDAVC